MNRWIADRLTRYLTRSPERRKRLWKQLRGEFEPKLEDQMRAKYPQLAFAMPGHFYSPLPDMRQAKAYESALEGRSEVPGVDMRPADQLQLMAALEPYFERYDWPATEQADRRYYSQNSQYLSGDAAMLYAMLCHYKPARVVEVGSGYSSAVMLDTRDSEGLSSHYTFIEPYPDRLNRLLRKEDLDRVTLIQKPVQDVELNVFHQLQAGDFLFIDSSHVSKAGSDVNHLVFEILPLLAPGVLVHVHDMFWPFQYPASWLEQGRGWNELYLLRAFLAYNTAWRVVSFGPYLNARHREQVPARMLRLGFGGYLWMVRETGLVV
jgi:predicted O-methyltransferase YrrM